MNAVSGVISGAGGSGSSYAPPASSGSRLPLLLGIGGAVFFFVMVALVGLAYFFMR